MVTPPFDQWMTTAEIRQQPGVWRKLAATIDGTAAGIRDWLIARDHDEVWFCGAGTSAFIGETLAPYLNGIEGDARFRAIATTDFVSSPRRYLRRGLRPLVVSFGRSGNSSETVGMLDLINKHAPHADKLNITCNGESTLARDAAASAGELRSIVLPPETNDRGFAMTSSYSSMLLTALACFDPCPPASAGQMFGRVADGLDRFLGDAFDRLNAVQRPLRAIFLGSGPLTGSARECALKVLELAAGRIVTAWDSTLGFRHGPKAVVDQDTLVFVLESSDPYTRQYDRDLATEIGRQFGPRSILTIGDAEDADIRVANVGNDAWGSVLRVVVAQVLAVVWSDQLGMNVDDPFAGRNLARVVTGVTLYDLPLALAETYGSIDVGGTKIEAALFDGDLEPLAKHRIETPTDSYEALVAAIVGQARWLEENAGSSMPMAIGLPGLIDPQTGRSVTSNLPATGHALSQDISDQLGRTIPVENDCKTFALSEANGGAGAGFRTVFGLILGTGVGGGVCIDGKLQTGLNGLPGEVGHFGIPGHLVAEYGLPILRCGCGRMGCYETLVSGAGLSRLAEHFSGKPVAAAEIMAAAARGDVAMGRLREIWLHLLAELVLTIQLTVDPDCVVLGGGLSKIDGLDRDLATVFEAHKLHHVRSPALRIARYGDASGGRGAAILAMQASLVI
ncbi:MAG: ROK family protein [Proteobacteria bacterium]|nr:ROK family protein [Pseudomonadota bacterium]